MSPKLHHRELTDIQKGEIIALSHYYKDTEIENELNIPQTTVESFLKWFREWSSAENYSQSGRPRKTSIISDQYLTRAALKETKLPL